MTHRRWFLVHSWVGLTFYVVLSVIVLSGTLSVIASEIDWLVYPEARVREAPRRLTPGEVVAAFRAAHPGVEPLHGFVRTSPDHGGAALRILGVSETEGLRTYWLDPHDGTARGSAPFLTVGTVAVLLHTTLFVPVVGSAVVSVFALFVLTSTISGIVTYRRWWRGYARLPRTQSTRLFVGDLHRLVAVWILPFLAVVGVTSLVYFWDFVGTDLVGLAPRHERPAPPEIDERPLREPGLYPPARLAVDALVARVLERHPNFEVSGVGLPQHADAPLMVYGRGAEWFTSKFDSTVALNPYTGKILGEAVAGTESLAERLNLAVDPLHFGTFGGLVTKMAWVGFGGCLFTLTITGVLAHVRRLDAGQGERGFWHKLVARGPMGRLKLANVALLAVGAAGLAGLVRMTAAPAERASAVLEERQVGPWRASLLALDESSWRSRPPLSPLAQPLVILRLCDGCAAAIRTAEIEVVNPRAAEPTRLRFEGGAAFLHARPLLPERFEGAELRLRLHGWDGQAHDATWPLVEVQSPERSRTPRPHSPLESPPVAGK